MKAQVATALILIAVVAGSGVGYFAGNETGRTATKTVTTTLGQTLTLVVVSESTQTSSSAEFITYFHFPISVNYGGSWNLAYWGQNGTASLANQVYCNACYGGTIQYNFFGSLSGSGSHQTVVTTYGFGYVENTLCVDAAILNSSSGTLTLTVLGKTGTATGLSPTVEVCATLAV